MDKLDNKLLDVVVMGNPIPQGSLKSVGRGRPLVYSNAAYLLPWRDSVTVQLRKAVMRRGGVWPLEGAVRVDVVFTMRKPKSAPRSRRIWPCKRPDVDKLARAVLDALTFAGVVADDAQVVDLIASKRYPREGDRALETPGARIHITPVE